MPFSVLILQTPSMATLHQPSHSMCVEFKTARLNQLLTNAVQVRISAFRIKKRSIAAKRLLCPMELLSGLEYLTSCCSPSNGKMVTITNSRNNGHSRRSAIVDTNFSREESDFASTSNQSNCPIPSSSIQEPKQNFPKVPLIKAFRAESRYISQTEIVSAAPNPIFADASEKYFFDEIDTSNPTALHKACLRGNTKVLEHLLDVLSYKNLDSVDRNGDTALHICARNGNYRACEILCEVLNTFANLGCIVLFVLSRAFAFKELTFAWKSEKLTVFRTAWCQDQRTELPTAYAHASGSRNQPQ